MPPVSHLTSRTPIKYNFYLANSLATAVSESDLYRHLTFQVPRLKSPFHCLDCTEWSVQAHGNYPFLNEANFYGEELLASCLTPKLEEHPLSTVCDCLFDIFAVTLHIGGHSSICNVMMLHVMVTGTHLLWMIFIFFLYIYIYIYNL